MDARVRDPNGGEPGSFSPHRQVRGLISAGIINNWISYWKFEQAFAIQVALVDLHKRHSEPGCLEVMTVIFASVMNKEETRREFHPEGSDGCAPLDHCCFNYWNILAINCFVETLY